MPANSEKVLYPGLLSQLPEILERKNIFDRLHHPLSWKRTVGILRDIFDGRVWQYWITQLVPGTIRQWFGSKEHIDLAFGFNCDGFKPNKSQYSVTAMYLVLVNLPREIRFLQENIILVALIPGPRGIPHEDFHKILKPLVDEFKCLYNPGLRMKIGGRFRDVHAILLFISVDHVALYDLVGMGSSSAGKCCTRCADDFSQPWSGGHPRPSTFNLNEFVRRTRADHVRVGQEWLNANSKEARKTILREQGYMFCAFLDLEYFDTITHHVHDPMHQLFLGLFKDFFMTLTDENLINEGDFHKMQETADRLQCPREVGRLPYKIYSQMANLKADQWKILVLVYLPFLFNGITVRARPEIKGDLQRMALLLNLICRLLCVRVISEADLNIVHGYIVEYCETFTRLFPLRVKPNMHYCLHLKEDCLNFGPVYSFWLFSFERYNGILSAFDTNNRCIETTFLRKFWFDSAIRNWRYLQISNVYSRSGTHYNTRSLGNIFDEDCNPAQKKLLSWCSPVKISV